MAMKKLAQSVKPKGAVKMAGKAPPIKAAAARTASAVGKGRRPAKPKMAVPQRLPMQPQMQQPQQNPAQGFAGVLPGQIAQ